MKGPRNKKYAEKPGAYNLATRVGKTTINPGEDFKIEQYITGYGSILQAKLVCYLSSDVFDSQLSYVNHSMKYDKETELMTWGNDTSNVIDPGLTLTLLGLKEAGWEESSAIIDIDSDSNRVSTEAKFINAPLDYNFKTLKSIAPGDHYIDFHLTYYNGEKWIITKEKIAFKVTNFFERHAKSISWFALVATTLSIIRFGVVPVVEFAYQQHIDSKNIILLEKKPTNKIQP